MRRGRGMSTANSSATRPGRLVSSTIRSPRRAASRTLWVTNRIVRPVASQIRSSSSWRMSRVMASRAPKGSSMRSTSESLASARASAARCRMPPESSCGWRFAKAVSWTISRSSATRSLRSPLGRRRSLRGSSTFRSTDSHGKRAASWNMNEGSPARWTEPRVGASRPATRFNRVDLPQPDAPRMETNSPALTVSEMSSSAVTVPVPLPKVLVTPSMRTVMRPAAPSGATGLVTAISSAASAGRSLTGRSPPACPVP